MAIRQDIQALRGLAVLVVVIFHAKLGIFEGGYLGVDIFFCNFRVPDYFNVEESNGAGEIQFLRVLFS